MSRDRPRRDVRGEGVYGARGIDHGEGAVASPQEAVEPPGCLLVESYDRPRRVDAALRHGTVE
jgi:hypothetical protein